MLLLLCSVPVLFAYLPQNYLQHYVFLVESRFLLLQDSISYEEFVKASRKLKHFCIGIHSLYGKRHYMYNIYNLLHLPYNVRQLDPIWVQSTFWYEGYNGGVNTVGLLQKDTLTAEEELIIRKRLSAINVSYSFDRIYFKRVVIHSISYRYMLKRNIFTVIYKSHFGSLYGHVQKYVKVLFVCSRPDQCSL